MSQNSLIFNGNQLDLSQNSGTLPDLSGAFLDWMQPLVFETIVKAIGLNGLVTETPTTYNFEGAWMPLSLQQLEIKKDGQRQWKWFQVFSQLAVPLTPDQVITYQGTQYRVMGVDNQNLYGYFRYELVEDFTGSGP